MVVYIVTVNGKVSQEAYKTLEEAQDFSGFNEPMGELFGRYCTIEMKRHYSDNEFYKHKVIGLFKSNTWVDVPIQSPATETLHKEMEDVIGVICCGIREDTVYRVRLKDVKLEDTHDNLS